MICHFFVKCSLCFLDKWTLLLFRLLTSTVFSHLRDLFLGEPGSLLREAISTQAAMCQWDLHNGLASLKGKEHFWFDNKGFHLYVECGWLKIVEQICYLQCFQVQQKKKQKTSITTWTWKHVMICMLQAHIILLLQSHRLSPIFHIQKAKELHQ